MKITKHKFLLIAVVLGITAINFQSFGQLEVTGNAPVVTITNTSAGSAAIDLKNSSGDFWQISGPRTQDGTDDFSFYYYDGTWARNLVLKPAAGVGIGNGITPASVGAYACYVNGTGFISGGAWSTSDMRLKEKIVAIEGPMDIINKLNGYSYYYKEMPDSVISLPTGKQIGLIAQDIQKVLPEAVQENENGFYAVNYDMIIPILVEGIKAQEKEIQKLREELANSQIVGATRQPAQPNTVTKPEDMPLLNQNQPNPFGSNTNITVYLPKSAGSAQLNVFDMNGKTFKTVNINERGNVTVTINSSELYAGMFLYNLIVDGKEVDVKRMLITQK